MTEQQVYQVVKELDDVELRAYDDCVLAEVRIDGSFQNVGNKAFNPLFSFISGRNTSQRKIAMTAPVLQEVPSGEPKPQEYAVAFVMPAGSTRADLPDPADQRVQLREVPAHTALAVRFSGRWSGSSFEKHVATIKNTALDQDYVLVGDPRYARFNPPWTPWFLRHNEVVWSIKEPPENA